MDNEHILSLLDEYEAVLIGAGYHSVETDLTVCAPHNCEECMNHLLSMIPKIRQFIEEGRREKAMRFLGFAQGLLFSKGFYSIESLHNHNKLGLANETLPLKK